MRKWAHFAHFDAVTMQMQVDMRDLLFPKEGVPASIPIPPRSGSSILRVMVFCRLPRCRLHAFLRSD